MYHYRKVTEYQPDLFSDKTYFKISHSFAVSFKKNVDNHTINFNETFIFSGFEAVR